MAELILINHSSYYFLWMPTSSDGNISICSLSMQSIFPMCHLSSELLFYLYAILPLTFQVGAQIPRWYEDTAEQKVYPDPYSPLSAALQLFSTSHVSPLSATSPPLCPLSPPSTSLYLFFFFLALAETWSLGSHTSVSPPSSLQNLPLWLLLPSKSRLADYGESRRGRQKDI